MIADEAAVLVALRSDPTIAANTSAYNGEPAVFNTYAPQDASLPYIVFEPIASAPFDTHSGRGYDTSFEVRCYAALAQGVTRANALAEAAYQALHERRGAVQASERWTFSSRVLSGPESIPPVEEEAIGRRLTVQIVTQEV